MTIRTAAKLWRRRPPSLKGSLLGALLFSASFAVAAFGDLGVITLLDLEPNGFEGTAAAVPTRPSPVADLLAQHDCWTGDAPADMEGDLPGHVVVTQGDGLRYGGPPLVSVALDHVFEAPVAGLVVHGFCR